MKYKDILRICAALILFLLTTSYSFAFESKTALIKAGEKLTLSDCIQIALDNSPNIKRAAYNYKISKNDVSIAKASFFPTLSVGTGYYYNGTYAKSRDINSNYYSANAGLNQLIWNFGKTNSQIKMQKFNKIAALYNFDNTVIDTIFNVKTNYYGVLAAKATMDINKANVDINERNDVIFMFDTLLYDESRHIHIGTKAYSSANEIVELVESELRKKSTDLWEELKYTVLLNAIYYKFVTDINFTKEVIKTKDRIIVFKSDNLEWGVQETEEGRYVGKNLLGLAVMELRDVLTPVYENYDDIDWELSGDPYSEERCSCGHVHT